MFNRNTRLRDTNTPLRFLGILAYSSPMVATSFLFGATGVVQGIYAKHYGLALTDIAAILLICRLFDAFTDPLIGRLSDSYFRRGGTRRPFVFAGSILFLISAYFLFTPPENEVKTHFLLWFLAYYFSWTLFDIPHLAWGSELSADSRERIKIFSIRTFMGNIGFLIFYALPQLPIFESSHITPEAMEWAVLFIGVLMLPLLLFSLLFSPSSVKKSCGVLDAAALGGTEKLGRGGDSFRKVLRIIFSNKPFCILLLAQLFSTLGTNMMASMLFIYVDVYLQLGSEFSQVMFLGLIMGMFAVWYWYWQAKQIGSKAGWQMGMIICAFGLMGLGFITPNDNQYLLLLVLLPLYFGMATMGSLAPSLLADIIDYAKLKFNEDYTATYFALFGLVAKSSFAMGGALAFYIAGEFGFDPAAKTHQPGQIFGLQLATAWVPAAITLLGVVLIYRVPMSRQRHSIILKALSRRQSRPIQGRDRTGAAVHVSATKKSTSLSLNPS